MGDNINIEFEVVSYRNTDDKVVYDTAVLSLYNVNRYWHNENSNNKLMDAQITIYAGIKATPLHYRQGIIDKENTCYALNDSQILERPIYQGYVSDTYANMDGQDTILTMNLVPVRRNSENISINQLNIANGSNWKIEVKRFIENYLALTNSTDIVIIGDPAKDNICDRNINSQNIAGIFDGDTNQDNGISLASYINNMFNETIYKQNNIIYIGEPAIKDNKTTIISDKDFKRTASTYKSLSNRNNTPFNIKIQFITGNRT